MKKEWGQVGPCDIYNSGNIKSANLVSDSSWENAFVGVVDVGFATICIKAGFLKIWMNCAHSLLEEKADVTKDSL